MTQSSSSVPSDSHRGFDEMLDGNLSQPEMVTFLRDLRDRGESVADIVAAVRAMRRRMIPVHLNKPAIDICGTGGGVGDRFNVSTACAFALAAIGIPVAKHGNRGSRSGNGSFDFLEALGVSIDLDAARAQSIFKQTDLCFLFARQFHPAVGTVASARRQVGGRTIFNLVGPLCNPAGVTRQILGTVSKDIAEKLAEACQVLGTEKTLVVIGSGGRDEVVLDGPSDIIEVTANRRIRYTINPQEWGIGDFDALPVGLADVNASIFKQWLNTPAQVPTLTHMIALNCGVAMYLVDHVATFKEGYEKALELVQTPVVRLKVSQYISS